MPHGLRAMDCCFNRTQLPINGTNNLRAQEPHRQAKLCVYRKATRSGSRCDRLFWRPNIGRNGRLPLRAASEKSDGLGGVGANEGNVLVPLLEDIVLDNIMDVGEEEYASGSWQEVTPPVPMEGVMEDPAGLTLEELVESDAVYNHELSWLSFNWRVLQLARDPAIPIVERLRFLAITAKNLDEFFAKRVGGLKRQEAAGVDNLLRKRRNYHWTPSRQLDLINRAVLEFVNCQMDEYCNNIQPALESVGVQLMTYLELTEEERTHFKQRFIQELEPLLTPLAVDPAHPFPYLVSLETNLLVVLKDPEELDTQRCFWAIVNLPNRMQRWMKLPGSEDDPEKANCFVAMEEVVVYNLDRLFGGMEILSVSSFRATRNADVERNEEEAEDLLEMMTDEVRERRFAPFVRLEVNADMDPDLVVLLRNRLKLTIADVYPVRGPLGIGDMFDLPVEFGMDTSHTFSHWAPMTHLRLADLKVKTDIFKNIRRGDILVHHPYHSFATSTQALLEAAAVDPKVVAIKATLYRTNSDSPIIKALITAANNGVQVAVLVELKARFDEERNVGFATRLENAGCNVAYGLIGLKTHCKTTLVVRQEEKTLRAYCHIGTGNYNPSTAAVYTDYGLLTCNPELGADVMDLFKYLTGYHRQVQFRQLLVAPTTMRSSYIRLIDQEIKTAREGGEGRITAKVNGMDDEVIAAKLYEASQAGVKVELIVRGICCVRPGIPGVSENIKVISIVGRFLEHHRVVRFHNNGFPKYFIGSADWMTRNLTRRVEVATPILDLHLQEELQKMLSACMVDATRWEMRSDGRYIRMHEGSSSGIDEKQSGGPIRDLTEESLKNRSAVVGMQMALVENYKLERKMLKGKLIKRATVRDFR